MEPLNLSEPLTALRQFHQLNNDLCEGLETLAAAAENGGEASALRAPAAEIHRHFGGLAVIHHKDEEEDLFPLLARQSLKLADRVHQARQGHEKLEAAWNVLGPILRDPTAMAADPATFATKARAFAQLQREHSSFEEEELFELAQHILGKEDLSKISKAMKKRRGAV